MFCHPCMPPLKSPPKPGRLGLQGGGECFARFRSPQPFGPDREGFPVDARRISRRPRRWRSRQPVSFHPHGRLHRSRRRNRRASPLPQPEIRLLAGRKTCLAALPGGNGACSVGFRHPGKAAAPCPINLPARGYAGIFMPMDTGKGHSFVSRIFTFRLGWL